MQTFLPYPDFRMTAECLDKKRLWKQVVECKQLLYSQFYNHPASRMWRNYQECLKSYYNVMLEQCIVEHGINTKLPFLIVEKIVKPHWLGDPAFHAAHRSNLLRKDPVFYGQYGWIEPNNLPYVWPC